MAPDVSSTPVIVSEVVVAFCEDCRSILLEHITKPYENDKDSDKESGQKRLLD